MKTIDICETCGEKAHDFVNEEIMECIPPPDVLIFGEYNIDSNYRNALYKEYPMYTTEEVVGSFLGHNPYFPSQASWMEKKI